jgi:hypothetical protein
MAAWKRSVKLLSWKQEPNTGYGLSIIVPFWVPLALAMGVKERHPQVRKSFITHFFESTHNRLLVGACGNTSSQCQESREW